MSALGLEWGELEELTGEELAELTQIPLELGQSIQRCCSRHVSSSTSSSSSETSESRASAAPHAEGHREKESKGATGGQEWGTRPYIALPHAQQNICEEHLLVSILGGEGPAQEAHTLQTQRLELLVTLRLDGQVVWSSKAVAPDLRSTFQPLRRLSLDMQEVLSSGTVFGMHTLHLDLTQRGPPSSKTGEEEGRGDGDFIPLYEHIVAFYVSNDMTCVTNAEQLRAAERTEEKARRARREALAGLQQRQHTLLLGALFEFATPPESARPPARKQVHTAVSRGSATRTTCARSLRAQQVNFSYDSNLTGALDAC
jgi:hypothetical protein